MYFNWSAKKCVKFSLDPPKLRNSESSLVGYTAFSQQPHLVLQSSKSTRATTHLIHIFHIWPGCRDSQPPKDKASNYIEARTHNILWEGLTLQKRTRKCNFRLFFERTPLPIVYECSVRVQRRTDQLTGWIGWKNYSDESGATGKSGETVEPRWIRWIRLTHLHLFTESWH